MFNFVTSSVVANGLVIYRMAEIWIVYVWDKYLMDLIVKWIYNAYWLIYVLELMLYGMKVHVILTWFMYIILRM